MALEFFFLILISPRIRIPSYFRTHCFLYEKEENQIVIEGSFSIHRQTHCCSLTPRPSPLKRPFFLGIIALSFLFLPFFFPPATEAEPVKIGLLTPWQESGTGADYPYMRGAEIAVAEINAIEGKQGIQLLLFARRGLFLDPKEQSALRDFLFEQRPSFLIGALRREAILPVSRLAQDHQIPILVFPIEFMEAASTGEEPASLFWISPTPEAFQRAAVRTAAQLSKKRFYLLARNSALGRNWVRYFWEAMNKLRPDAQRRGETFLPLRIDDYRPYLQGLFLADTEACISHLGVKDWLDFYSLANKEGYFKKISHLELESGTLESLVALKKKVPDGVWGISAFPFWALGWQETKEFVSKYRKNTNSYPSLAALSGYISIYALFKAIQKAGSTDSEKAFKVLEDLTFHTPVGPMTIRKSDHRTMWPIWCGSLQSTSDYPFPIIGNLKSLGPDSFSSP